MAIGKLNRSVSSLNASLDKLRDVVDRSKTDDGVDVAKLRTEAAKLKDADVDRALDSVLSRFSYYEQFNALYEDGRGEYRIPERLSSTQVETVRSALLKSKSKLTRVAKSQKDDGEIDFFEAEQAFEKYWGKGGNRSNTIAKGLVRDIFLIRSTLPKVDLDVPEQRQAAWLGQDLNRCKDMMVGNAKGGSLETRLMRERMGDHVPDTTRKAFETIVAHFSAEAGRPAHDPLTELSPEQIEQASRALTQARRLVILSSASINDDGMIDNKEAYKTLGELIDMADSGKDKLALAIAADIMKAAIQIEG